MKNNKGLIIVIVVLVICVICLSGYVVYDLVVGEKSENNEIKLTMNCKETIMDLIVKEDSELLCDLLGEEYKFTIKKISDDTITISTDKDGVSTGPGILDSEKEWSIKKGEKLVIHTNSTDWQDEVEFSW